MKISKLMKFAAIAGVGMLLAPKDGKSLRTDFKNKYESSKPKLKKMSKQVDVLFERAKTMNSDSAKTAAKEKLDELKASIKSIDGNSVKNGTAKTFKALQKGINKVATDIRKNEKLIDAVKKTGKAAVDVTLYTGEKTAAAISKVTGATIKKSKAMLEENPDSTKFSTKVAKIIVNTEKGTKIATDYTKENIMPKIDTTVKKTKQYAKEAAKVISNKPSQFGKVEDDKKSKSKSETPLKVIETENKK